MFLIFEPVESNVCWWSRVADVPRDAMRASTTWSVVSVMIKYSKVDPLSVNDDVQAVEIIFVPAVDFVEVEHECYVFCIGRDIAVEFPWIRVILGESAQELCETSATIQPSVVPSGKASVLKVFDRIKLYIGNTDSWSGCGNWRWLRSWPWIWPW